MANLISVATAHRCEQMISSSTPDRRRSRQNRRLGLVALALLLVTPEETMGSTSMKDAILKALEQVNADVVERRWPTYYLDVSDRFKDVIKDTSFEQLLRDFAELSDRKPAAFNANNFVESKTYYVGILHPGLSRLGIYHNNFRSSWDLLINVRYIKENRYEFIEAIVKQTPAWP